MTLQKTRFLHLQFRRMGQTTTGLGFSRTEPGKAMASQWTILTQTGSQVSLMAVDNVCVCAHLVDHRATAADARAGLGQTIHARRNTTTYVSAGGTMGTVQPSEEGHTKPYVQRVRKLS